MLMRGHRHLAALICIALLPLLGLVTASAQDAAGEAADGGEESPLSLRVGMFQTVYEAEQVLRGELSVINTSEEWVEVQDVASLASALTVRTAEGKPLELDQKAAKKFGAANAEKIGPGGFVGLTFDAGQLFPDRKSVV